CAPSCPPRLCVRRKRRTPPWTTLHRSRTARSPLINRGKLFKQTEPLHGTGDILEFLPPVHYVGYDISQDYIDRARRLFGHRAEFHCRALADDLPVATDSFDVVIAHGLLHHLNDGDARTLFRLARRALRPGGRLVTYDGCFAHGQSAAAWLILSLDRGRHVREPASYEALARTEFEQVRSVVRHDLIRIPYTHIIMECSA
ncbi:MAG: class I SAM-dependent methyltransferase, partial [Betaproteobacteria bacterium]|nr:class I SAM-dependent methyltransferase [Betaproteobacteria bacterium]